MLYNISLNLSCSLQQFNSLLYLPLPDLYVASPPPKSLLNIESYFAMSIILLLGGFQMFCHHPLFSHYFLQYRQFFLLFTVTPITYGSSWVRVLIAAAPAGLHHSMATPDLSSICNLSHSLQQCWILYLLSEARD